jgi:soluble lytic murein transglycosylase-like protein
VAAVLFENRQDLRNTRRWTSQKQDDYRDALEEQRVASAELRRHEGVLDLTIHKLGVSKAQTEERLHALEAVARARTSRDGPATGGGEVCKESELKLAPDHLVAETVEPISGGAYMDLYRASARDYGLNPGWSILAAVGKVESEHGRNMGPSSAGAMGPMQFLPST